MAKQSHAPDVIEEFESAAERMAHWIGEHAWAVGGALLLVLAIAGGWGGYHSWSRSQEQAASNALDAARAEYLVALGARPGALEPPELANPAAAAAIREESLTRFQEVAEAHSGTVAGTLALLEVASLLEELDRPEQSDEVWRQALSAARGNPGLEGLLRQRVAASYERRGDWAAAAGAHEEAGSLEGYPLRYWALVDAARCYDAAGQPAHALELYEQVEREAPDLTLPDHLRSRYRELRATQAG